MEIIDANTIFGVWPKREMDVSIERLLTIMKENKVAKSLSVSIKGILYDYGEGNAETLKISKNCSRVIPVATCDLRKYYGKKGFVKKVVESGFKALRLFPDLQGWPINYEPFYDLWDEMQSFASIPLIITAAGSGFITALSKLSNNGKVAVIINSVAYDLFAEALAVLKKHACFYLDTAFIDTPDGHEIFAREIGADRLVFGSYSPMNYFRSSFANLERANLKDEEKLLIASGNIKRMLGV